MSRTRIHNLSISLDGFATGEPQSADAPFGHAGERLHEWMFATRFWTTPTGRARWHHHDRGTGRRRALVRPRRRRHRDGVDGRRRPIRRHRSE